VYSAPLDLCVKCFLNAVLLFTDDHPASRRLDDVRLVNNDAESTVTSIVLVRTQLDMGISVLTADAREMMNAKDDTGFASGFGRDLNLPRGRQESSTRLSSTFSGSTAEQLRKSLVLSQIAADYGSGTSTRDPLLRTSLGRDVTKDASDDRTSRAGDYKTGGRDAEGSMSRQRAGSLTKSGSPSKSFSQTISGVSGLKLDDYDNRRDSSRSPKSSDTGARAAPVIKLSLLSGSSTSQKLGKYSSTSSGSKTSEGIGAKGHSPLRHEDRDEDHGLQSLPADLSKHPSYRERFLQGEGKKDEECVICLSRVRNPKALKCGHVFCSSCIDEHFKKSKPSCPTCGSIYGRVQGTQPRDGKMSYVIDRSRTLPGYENEDGMIEITYYFPDGVQQVCILRKILN